MPVSAYALQPGDKIAGYTIESVIGRGGMGIVYLATQGSLTRKVALKILSPELSHDPEFRQRFTRESEIAASLEHPNVLPIYDAGETGDVLFLAMRYVDGPDLRDLLSRALTLTPQRTISIVRSVGGALDAAHIRGLIHRDVKPANILISRDGGHVYLSDFGLARTVEGASITRAGSFLGSVAYCAPEQIEGRPLDGRADLYALACVAFECLTGQTPFPRDSEVAIIKAHLHDPPPPVTRLRPELPRPLDAVYEIALSKRSEDRFASVGELVDALEAAMRGVEPTGQTSEPALQPRHAATAYESTPTKVAQSPPGRPALLHRRKLALWSAIAAAAILAAASGAAVVWLTRGGSASPATTATHTTGHPKVTIISVTEQMIPKLTGIAKAQAKVNTRLRDLAISTVGLEDLIAASSALERQILEAQGFSASLTPNTASDRSMLKSLDVALNSHARYAGQLVHLPADASSLTRDQTDAIVAAGEEAAGAYASLASSAPSLPVVPINYTDNTRLGLAVPETPATAPLVTTTTTLPSGTVPAPSPSGGVPAGLTTYPGRYFTIAYPSSWNIDVAEQNVSYGVDTTIRDSDAPARTYLRVDYTLHARISRAREGALSQRSNAVGRPGYREIGFGATTLAGYDATRWEFEIVDHGVLVHKVDTFLLDSSGTGFAILTQAPATSYAGWRGTFDAMYASFAIR